MIGINDPFNNADVNPFDTLNGRENDWQERQRRQRTIRLMLMFIMMLILMDGEEAEHRRNSKNRTSLLRKHVKESSSTTHALRPQSLYDARRSMDRRIEAVSLLGEGNHRMKNLLKLNGDKNEEAPIIDWAVKHLYQDNEQSHKTTTDGTLRKKKDSESIEDLEAKRLVYVYPYNTTGYYRGVWKSKREHQDNLSFLNYENLSQDEVLVVTSSIVHKEIIQNALAKADFSFHINVISQDEVSKKVTDKIFTLDKRIGVFIMPKHTRVLSFDLVNLFNSNFESEQNQNYTKAILEFLDVSNLMKTDEQNPTLSLTEENGRAAFQLFSRPIPGMTQISLVDGFVKLFDGEGGPFPSKNDVLLRVRGVAIHKIGKLSLVSNAGFGRSGMLILDKRSTSRGTAVLQSQKEDDESKQDDKSKQENISSEFGEQRRLTELIDSLPSSSSSEIHISHHQTVEEIRENVISSYDNYWNEETIGGHSWSELYSSAPEFDTSLGDLYMFDYAEMNLFSKISSIFDTGRIRKNLEWLFPYGNDDTKHMDFGENDFISDDIKKVTDDSREFNHRQLKQLNFASNLNDSLLKNNNAILSSERLGDPKEIPSVKPSERKLEKEQSINEQDDDNDPILISSNEKQTKNDEMDRENDIQNLLKQEWMDFSVNTILSFPYVPDDPKRSLRSSSQSTKRRLPSREDTYIDNAKGCEFEINLDLRAEKRTVGDWRQLVLKQMKNLKELNPRFYPLSENNETDKETHDEKDQAKRSIRSNESTNIEPEFSLTKSSNSDKTGPMVMNMLGEIKSPNCNFAAHLNVTAIRPDWENTTGKAINYSFFMMITCLTQIVVLLRQLLHTQAQSVATRVSLLCIGWQTVLDAMICIEHMLLCLLLQPLFTAFASVAFFKLLIFCVIEMKYMSIIMQARNTADNVQTTVESLRRQVAFLHLKFYLSLMFALIMIYFIGQHHRTIYMVLLYSFWVPQIIRNVITEAKKPLHTHYICGMSITRLIAPTYFLAFKNNFLKSVSPEFPTDVSTVQILFIWIAIQTAILLGQGKYGARFMIPARFLPPKFDYSRPIPPSLLPQQTQRESLSSNCGESSSILGADTESPTTISTTSGPRNRLKGNRPRKQISDEHSGHNGVIHQNESTINGTVATLDCVICYNAIDINDRKKYMLAPCDHIFHRDCLEQWMEVKMECPICRKNLPSL